MHNPDRPLGNTMNTLPSRRQFLQTLAWGPLVATGLTGCGGSSGDVAPDLPKVAVSTRRLAFSALGDSVEALPNENLVVQIDSATRKGWQYGGDFGQDAVLLTPWAVIATETRRFILERARQRVVVLDADGAPAMPFLLALRHDGVLHVQASFDTSAGAVHRLYPHLI